MEDIRPKGAWYSVYLDRAEGSKPACIDVYKLAEVLPHGSGIDGTWTIKVKRNGDIVVYGEYHAMDGNGFYCGWRNFRFTIARPTKNEYTKLIGRCEGQFQITRFKGVPYFSHFVGGGDARDYLYDTCYFSLHDGMGVSSIESGVSVSSEESARQLVPA